MVFAQKRSIIVRFLAAFLAVKIHWAATSNKIACGTTSSTKPSLKARLALICRPVKIISKAIVTPIKRGNLWVPPEPGSNPN